MLKTQSPRAGSLEEEDSKFADEENEPFLSEKRAALRDGVLPKVQRSDVRYIATIMALSCLVLVGFITTLVQAYRVPALHASSAPSAPLCESMTWRREWRTLSEDDRKSFTGAILRLMHMPSKIGFDNQSRYDDFQFTHGMTLDKAHRPGIFLAWHRYYIKVFENVLRHEGGYRGYLPYWDWTNDWKNLSASPVFDNVTGFGGNGNPASDEVSWRGYCVTTGPFAYHQVPYRYVEVAPHCLSRDFATQEFADTISWGISPASINELLEVPKFSHFTNMLESQSIHLPVIKFVVGDLSTRAAPGEPLWWVHHAQIDRLYWTWQQQNPNSQLLDFDPFGDFGREEELPDVSGDEVMDIGALGDGTTVKSMFDTRSDFLCYGYK